MAYNLYAFGSNGEGQLGLGFASDKVHTPTKVQLPLECNLGRLNTICGGGNHTLVLINDEQDASSAGCVWAAGSNRSHQLGNQSDGDDDHIVLRFRRLDHIGSVLHCAAAWESSAYVSVDRQTGASGVVTEGRCLHGELGRGKQVDIYPAEGSNSESGDGPGQENTKLVVPGEVSGFAAGMYHYVSIIPGSGRNGDENCSVYGWGRARQGQLGVKTEAYYPRPTTIKDIPFKPEKVVCGQNFTYLVGDPATGEHLVLGIDKHGIQSKKPERVKGWKDIGATWNAIFVLFQDGTLTAWGKSDLWDLIPPDLPKIEQIAVGSDHVLALTVDNKLLAWGWAVHGNCGETASLKLPLAKGYVKGQYNEIGFEGEIVKIAAGYSTSFVVTRERQQLEPDYEMTESKEKHHDEN